MYIILQGLCANQHNSFVNIEHELAKSHHSGSKRVEVFCSKQPHRFVYVRESCELMNDQT